MILEKETYEKFGYWPSELKPKTHKRILVACDMCGKIREIGRADYRPLCRSCAASESQKGEKNPMFGKHPSAETLRKLSEARRNISEETRQKMSESHKGKKHIEETIRKIREWHTGRTHTVETKQKLSELNKGKVISAETRKKISKAEKGRVFSAETRRKLSDARKRQIPPMLGKFGRYHSPETKEKIRKARQHRVFPTNRTKPEMIFLEFCKKDILPFRYTGDGSFWISGKPAINPDFIHLTEKIAIEIFSYWHDPLRRNGKVRYSATYEGRKELLKKRGWKLIVFWQEDLERDDAEQFVLSVLRKEGIIK